MIFLSIAVILSVVLIVFVINSIQFIETTAEAVLTVNKSSAPPVKFEFEKLQNLGIINQ